MTPQFAVGASSAACKLQLTCHSSVILLTQSRVRRGRTRGAQVNSIRYGATVGALVIGLATTANAADRLTLYCSPQEEWCQIMVTAFEKETGISVAMTRKSSGETYAQIRAEKDNPKGDVWWGGTGDPHLQAAEEDLTEAYESPLLGELHAWAVTQHKAAGGRTVGI